MATPRTFVCRATARPRFSCDGLPDGLPSEFEQAIHSQLGDEAPHSVERDRNAIATPPDRNQPSAAYLSGKMDVSGTTRVCLNVEQLVASGAHLPLRAGVCASARVPHWSLNLEGPTWRKRSGFTSLLTLKRQTPMEWTTSVSTSFRR